MFRNSQSLGDNPSSITIPERIEDVQTPAYSTDVNEGRMVNMDERASFVPIIIKTYNIVNKGFTYLLHFQWIMVKPTLSCRLLERENGERVGRVSGEL